MLRVSELIPAVKLAQAVGERPHGHFDHDANGVSGPHDQALRNASPTDVRVDEKDRPTSGDAKVEAVAHDRYEEYLDPTTGELLYKRR